MKIGKIKVYGIIYKMTNRINGKVYIGQTIEGFDRRYRKDFCKLHDGYLKNAINKYGIENFEIIKIFDIAFSKEELDVKEKCWIKIFNSNNKKYGYNLTEGGQNVSTYANKTEEEMKEIKEKISKSNKISQNRPETKALHSKNGKRYWLNLTNEEKIKQIRKHSKPVICITTNKIFYSAKESSKYYGVNNSDITKCCRGYRVKSAGKLPDGTKLVWMFLKDFLNKCEYILL